MGSHHEDLFAQLKADFDADTGAGGLNEANAVSRVSHFLSEDDPMQRGSANPTYIEVVMRDVEIDTISNGTVDMVVEFRIFTHRDRGSTPRDFAVNGLRTLFHNPTGLATASWRFDSMVRLGGSRAGRNAKQNAWSERYRVIGRAL